MAPRTPATLTLSLPLARPPSCLPALQHHLFPAVNPRYYPAISAIVQEVSARRRCCSSCYSCYS